MKIGASTIFRKGFCLVAAEDGFDQCGFCCLGVGVAHGEMALWRGYSHPADLAEAGSC
jgi:hypothetical protein